jgi:hypothetical protein
MYPASHHLIRPATHADALMLRRLAYLDRQPPLTGRIHVVELHGTVVAAISCEERRTIADRALTPAYLTVVLRLRIGALEAIARQPALSERMREAVLGARRLREPRSPHSGIQTSRAAQASAGR